MPGLRGPVGPNGTPDVLGPRGDPGFEGPKGHEGEKLKFDLKGVFHMSRPTLPKLNKFLFFIDFKSLQSYHLFEEILIHLM